MSKAKGIKQEDVCPHCKNDDINEMDFQAHEIIDEKQWRQIVKCLKYYNHMKNFGLSLNFETSS